MKPNEKQIMLAKIVEQHAIFWQSTNDINSPTHFCEMDDDVNQCDTFNDFSIDESIKNEFLKKMEELYIIIKNIK